MGTRSRLGNLAKIEELLDSADYDDNKVGADLLEVYQRENPADLSLIETPHHHRLVVVYWRWYERPCYDSPTVAQKEIATARGTRRQLFEDGWNIYWEQILHIGIEDERRND